MSSVKHLVYDQFVDATLLICWVSTRVYMYFLPPYMFQVAKQVIDKRLQDQDDMAADDGDESDPSSTPPLVSW